MQKNRKKIAVYSTTAVLCLLIAAPPIIALLFISEYGVDVPFADQWGGFVTGKNGTLKNFLNGTLTLENLFHRHVVHRIFFPRIAMLTLSIITGYNVVMEMYFSMLMLTSALALIFMAYRKEFSQSKLALLAFIPISMILFSLAQQRNLLLGFQVLLYMCYSAAIASFYFLRKCEKPVDFTLAIAFGVIASFSLISGLNVWPIGVLQILLSKAKNKLRISLIWGASGIISGLIYFNGWMKPKNYPPMTYSLEHPIESISFLVANIGAPFSPTSFTIASIAGVLMLAAIGFLAYMAIQKRTSINSFWLALIGFSLLSILETTAGRTFFGVEYALTSRYATVTSIGLIGIYAIFLKHRLDSKINSIVFWALLLMIIIGYTGALFYGIEQGQITKEKRSVMAEALLNYKNLTDEEIVQSEIHPNAKYVREGAKILEENCMSVFTCGDNK